MREAELCVTSRDFVNPADAIVVTIEVTDESYSSHVSKRHLLYWRKWLYWLLLSVSRAHYFCKHKAGPTQ